MVIACSFLTLYVALNVLLVWHDMRHGLLPDRFTCPLLWCGLAYACLRDTELLPDKVWGAIAGYLGFAFLYWGYRLLRGCEGLGYGDIKFLAALGAWHGWQALSMLVFIAAVLAFATVSFSSIMGKKKMAQKNPLPFGPFLAGAGLITGYQELFQGAISFQL
jgi:leader peptidase HopD